MSIPVERCIVSRELTEPRLHPDGTCIVYAMSVSGVAALMLDRLDGTPPRQLTAHPAPRPGRGFGGGCWCWLPNGDAVIYAAVDGNLWIQPVPWGAARQLTSVAEGRGASAPAATADGCHVVYVIDDAEVWCTSLVDGASRRVDDAGADFVFDPTPTPDSVSVSWQAWNVPDMAWDASRVESATLDGARRPPVAVDGSVQQVRFTPAGRPLYLRDDRGWLNVWLGDEPIVEEPYEHGGPSWGMGQRSFALSPGGDRVAFTRNEAGFGRLCVVDIASRAVRDVARGVHGQLSWAGHTVAALRSGARTPTQVVVYDDTTWERNVVAIGPLAGWEDAPLAEPELLECTAVDGTRLHARLYRADAPTTRLLCWLHGGPTDQWQVTFMPRVAYWRSRGWNVLVPDHRGSTGHGRAYQQAMRHRWGVLDVADTAAVVEHAHTIGVGTPNHTIAVGSSAGGFTALWVSATHPDSVGGVVAAYPVTDLVDLVQRSHRFEAHYCDSLVGQLPTNLDRYRQRSPINHPSAFTRRPVLLLHGTDDPVVPVDHSIAFAEAVRAAGGDVDLVIYDGEGHGFRKPENQLDEYRRMDAFLGRTVRSG